MTGGFIKIDGIASDAQAHADEYFRCLELATRGTRIDNIRDPLNHIIRPMLGPEWVVALGTTKIYFYRGGYYVEAEWPLISIAKGTVSAEYVTEDQQKIRTDRSYSRLNSLEAIRAARASEACLCEHIEKFSKFSRRLYFLLFR